MQDPPARNWFCGAVTKPDLVQNGVAQYPVCGGAFFAPGIEPTAGYSFMSVPHHRRCGAHAERRFLTRRDGWGRERSDVIHRGERWVTSISKTQE